MIESLWLQPCPGGNSARAGGVAVEQRWVRWKPPSRPVSSSHVRDVLRLDLLADSAERMPVVQGVESCNTACGLATLETGSARLRAKQSRKDSGPTPGATFDIMNAGWLPRDPPFACWRSSENA